MKSDPVVAIGSSAGADLEKSYRAMTMRDVIDLSLLSAPENGAYIKSFPKIVDDPVGASLNLQNVHSAISHGMSNGFVRKQLNLVAQKLEVMDQPGSNITAGSMTRDMLVLHQRFSVADSFSKASNKLSESLMTLVKG
jgi:hypothetical protein